MEGLGVVGREAELSEVDAFLAAASGEFAALALEGAAGIGKTTVWERGRRRAEERGAHVVWCRPSVAEAKFSFAGVGDLLARVEEETLGALPDPQREALAVAMLRAKPARAWRPASRLPSTSPPPSGASSRAQKKPPVRPLPSRLGATGLTRLGPNRPQGAACARRSVSLGPYR
ncbi:MAG TPA: AAA family ATPase [Solirubrobacteraceae bacterium]|nr:AAA family ATPase [Solirubrobacteraceae bacterium]